MSEQREHDGQGGHPEPMVMMAHAHFPHYRFTLAVCIALALWLIFGPFTFRYQSQALLLSDILSGLLVIALALWSLWRKSGWPLWANAFVGLWLLFAPLLFWAPEPFVYLNDTLVGAMLITFALLIPMGMEMGGEDIPPGWSYNPSTWPQRAPIIALALLSFFASRHLAAVQLGYLDSAWDPFFAEGSNRVLSSEVSRAWPVSDAGLGTMVYLIEALMGFMGDKRRWRTMPWMVAIFGVVVIPLGVVSIVLVILQPLAVGAWCTICLFTAALMLLMIPLSLDEVVAMIQFVARKKREGIPVWRSFFLGGEVAERPKKTVREETWRTEGMLWGLTLSWPLLLCAALGLWLMFAPSVLGSFWAMADSSHLVGALVIVFAIIALAEVGRTIRFLNILLGLWLLIGPWFLSGGSTLARLNSALVGALLIGLSLSLGKIRDSYGTFDPYVSWNPLPKRARDHEETWGPGVPSR